MRDKLLDAAELVRLQAAFPEFSLLQLVAVSDRQCPFLPRVAARYRTLIAR
jgi:hypothetical protein